MLHVAERQDDVPSNVYRPSTPMTLARASAVRLHELLLPATRTAFRAAHGAHAGEGLYVFGLYVATSGQVYATFNTRGSSSNHAAPADPSRWIPEDFVYHARNRVLFADVNTYLDRVPHDEERYFLVTNTCVDVLATLDRGGIFGRGDARDGLVLSVFVAGHGPDLSFARRLNAKAALTAMEADLAALDAAATA